MSGKHSEKIAIREIDHKGRITIPKKIRKHNKYMISFDGECIFLEPVKE